MELLLGWAIIGGAVGAFIASAKGASVGGHAVLGAFLGPLGWLITAVGAGPVRRCPHCRGGVPLEAKVCQHCARELIRPAALPASVPAGTVVEVSDDEDLMATKPPWGGDSSGYVVAAGTMATVIEDKGEYLLVSSDDHKGWLPREKLGVPSAVAGSPGGAPAFQAEKTSQREASSSQELDTLERLAALHKSGVLTDEEFAAKKKQVLGI